MEIRVIRSRRRRRTASARIKNEVLEIRLPAWILPTEAQKIINKFTRSFEKRKKPRITSDRDLKKLADKLNQQYFQGELKFRAICWAKNQNTLHGSCSYKNRTIRISNKLKTVPKWVLKAIIVHELTHLLVPNHSKKFWQIANRYPLMERSRGYLQAFGKTTSKSPK